MNKRRAKRIAYKIASSAVEDARDNWDMELQGIYDEDDQARVREGLDEISNQLARHAEWGFTS